MRRDEFDYLFEDQTRRNEKPDGSPFMYFFIACVDGGNEILRFPSNAIDEFIEVWDSHPEEPTGKPVIPKLVPKC